MANNCFSFEQRKVQHPQSEFGHQYSCSCLKECMLASVGGSKCNAWIITLGNDSSSWCMASILWEFSTYWTQCRARVLSWKKVGKGNWYIFPPFRFPYLHSKCFRRDEGVLDNLLTHTINADFALKSMIGEAELLIFTSLQLPQNFHSESKTSCIQRIMLLSLKSFLWFS